MRTPRDGFNPGRRTVQRSLMTPNTMSPASHIRRLEELRAELTEQVRQRRMLHMIKLEPGRTHHLGHLKKKETPAPVEAEPADYDYPTMVYSKKDPVPAFPPIEDGVDFSWIHHPFASTYNQNTADGENEFDIESHAKEPGLVLIMTPILPEDPNEMSIIVDGNSENEAAKTSNVSQESPVKSVSTNTGMLNPKLKKVPFIKETNVDESDSDDSDEISFGISVISDSDCDYEYA